jgi:hypothetical protein
MWILGFGLFGCPMHYWNDSDLKEDPWMSPKRAWDVQNWKFPVDFCRKGYCLSGLVPWSNSLCVLAQTQLGTLRFDFQNGFGTYSADSDWPCSRECSYCPRR